MFSMITFVLIVVVCELWCLYVEMSGMLVVTSPSEEFMIFRGFFCLSVY